MKRGDFISIALSGDFGKPRPALVIQADLFSEHSSVTVLPVTNHLLDAPLLRITLEVNKQNGLHTTSQIMVDKAVTVKREKTGAVFGQIDTATLLSVERSLALFLGIAK